NAARLGGLLAGATHARVTLLCIAENPSDEQPLRRALDQETDILRRTGVELQTAIQMGEPTAQILGETSAKKYDLIVVGSRRRNASGRTYEIIKAIEPPVLVAIGACERLSRILLCSGGKHFIVDQLLDEMREGNYDLIVTGSSRARGPLRHYIMGDVTRHILDSAECSVLVARYRPPGPAKGLWQSLARLFRLQPSY